MWHVGAFIRPVRTLEVGFCILLRSFHFKDRIIRVSVNEARALNCFFHFQVVAFRAIYNKGNLFCRLSDSLFLPIRRSNCLVGEAFCLFNVEGNFRLLFRFFLFADGRANVNRLLRLGACVIFLLLNLRDLFNRLFRFLFRERMSTMFLSMGGRRSVIFNRCVSCFRLGPIVSRRGVLILQVSVSRPTSRFLRCEGQSEQVICRDAKFA